MYKTQVAQRTDKKGRPRNSHIVSSKLLKSTGITTVDVKNDLKQRYSVAHLVYTDDDDQVLAVHSTGGALTNQIFDN